MISEALFIIIYLILFGTQYDTGSRIKYFLHCSLKLSLLLYILQRRCVIRKEEFSRCLNCYQFDVYAKDVLIDHYTDISQGSLVRPL